MKIWILFSRCKNNIFLPLENKIHIFAPPCNILYVLPCTAMYCYVLPCITMNGHILPCIDMYSHITMYWHVFHVLPCTGMYTGRKNVFPYFVNSTETWTCLNPSRFRPAETWWSSFSWTGRVSVMFPSRKRTIIFPPHFCYHISVLPCFHYVSGVVFFKSMSKIAW